MGKNSKQNVVTLLLPEEPSSKEGRHGSGNSMLPPASVIFCRNVCEITADEVIILEHVVLLAGLVTDSG